jgi:hypothetical protein
MDGDPSELAILHPRDEPVIKEYPDVVRHRWLPQTEHVRQLPDSRTFVRGSQNDAQDLQASRVGDSSQRAGKFLGRTALERTSEPRLRCRLSGHGMILVAERCVLLSCACA